MVQRYIFDVFDFRLHYTLQLKKEKEMLWRFCCGMEPTSMKKELKIFMLEKQMRERDRERERERAKKERGSRGGRERAER